MSILKIAAAVSILLLTSLAGTARAGLIVYNNSTTDMAMGLDLVGIYDGVGDSITLSGNIGPLYRADIAIYNAGSDGTLDATLRFFSTGSPVGLQIGPDYTVTDVDLFGAAETVISFGLGGLSLPDDVVFLVTVANVSAGVIPQLELYGPSPSVGSNTADTAIVLNGVSYSQEDTSGIGGGNPYFVLATPEPSEWLLMASGLGALLGYARRRHAGSC